MYRSRAPRSSPKPPGQTSNLHKASHRRDEGGVLSIDLDHFSRLYETLSHSSCDLLIKAVAERLMDCIGNRPNTVARLSEDQFIIILADIGNPKEAEEAARKVLDSVSRPFALQDQEAFLTCSIGISLFPADSVRTDDLIRNAEAAMHHSKKCGGNQVHYYAPEFHIRSADRLFLENGLRGAIEHQSFVRDIKSNSKNAVITMAMIEMAHNLNLKVVAEGVETNSELLFLHLNHCDAMQGFLFSPAVSATEFEKLLASGKRLPIQAE